MMKHVDVAAALNLGTPLVIMPPRMAHGCAFLDNSRAGGGGWPQYRGGPISLHHTALVIEALSAADSEKYAVDIAQAVSRVDSEYRDLSSLDESSLADLLIAEFAEAISDKGRISAIAEELRARLSVDIQQPQRLRLREFSRALWSMSKAKLADDFVTACAHLLLDRENRDKGGWSGSVDGSSSVIVTSYVIMVLRSIDDPKSRNAIQRGVRFLEHAVSGGGWERIGSGDDVFAQATVLTVMADCGTAGAIDQGLLAIGRAVNADGGWGGGVGGPSTIESTAAVIKALVACGEHQYVPYRIAAANLALAVHDNELLSDRLENIGADLEARVSQQCGEVVQQRNQLREEKEQLESSLQELRVRSDELQREALEEVRRNRSLSRYFLRDLTERPEGWTFRISLAVSTLLVFIGAFSLELYLKVFALTGMSALVVAVVTILGGSVAAAYLVLVRRRSQFVARFAYLRAQEMSERLTISGSLGLAVEFHELIAALDAESTEHLTYAIMTRLVDMPPDVGIRYADRALSELEIFNPALLSWVERFLDLSPYLRRAIIDQIQRSRLQR